MDIRAIYDFYFMEAILVHPPKFGNKAQEKLRDDAQAYQDRVVENLAPALYDYLFMACMGEARHAYNKTAKYIPNIERGGGRSQAYHTALNFDRTKMLPALHKLFTQTWGGGGYGGGSWANIASGAMEYGVLPDKAFIDHVIDLEHNGGHCFDKTSVSKVIDLEMKSMYMKRFLDWKFEDDILHSHPSWFVSMYEYWAISKVCMSLLNRYYNTRGKDMPPKIDGIPTLKTEEFITYKQVEFGDDVPDEMVAYKSTSTSIGGSYATMEQAEQTKETSEIYTRYLKAIQYIPSYPLRTS